MSNSEPVYQHRGTFVQPVDTTALNNVLSTYNPIEVDCCESGLNLIRLRHGLIASLLETPKDLKDYRHLIQQVTSLVSNQIWDLEDQQKILEICCANWQKKLLPKLSREVGQIVSEELKAIPCLLRVDIKFAINRHALRQTPVEDFLYDHILPVLRPHSLGDTIIGLVFKTIEREYSKLLVFA